MRGVHREHVKIDVKNNCCNCCTVYLWYGHDLQIEYEHGESGLKVLHSNWWYILCGYDLKLGSDEKAVGGADLRT